MSRTADAIGEWRGEELKNALGHDCRMRGGIG